MGYIRVYNAGELIDQKELQGDSVSIGRTEDNGIVLPDSGVSRHHAAIRRDGDGWVIEDTGSRNGVFMKDQRIERQKLRYWDEIQIQQFVIRFMATPTMAPGQEAAPAAPSAPDADRTQFVSLKSQADLKRLRQQKRLAYVELRSAAGEQVRRPLTSGRDLIIGGARDADIRIRGWFVPAVAARIERTPDGYQLVPGRRGRVQIEGDRLDGPTPIEDGEAFQVRGSSFRFFDRLTD